MITVIASISVKPGSRDEFVGHFKANIPHVLEEDGCIEYAPFVDLPTDLPPQEIDENRVTIIEKWESVDALKKHSVAPHMKEFRIKAKDLMEKTTIKIFQAV